MWIRIAALSLLASTAAAPTTAQDIWSDEFASHQPNHDVHALLEHDDGTGATMYIGGAFTRAGVTPAAGAAKWTGDGWAALGAGIEGVVFDMASMTVDGQPALVVAGEITAAGGAPTENLAVWMDEQWHTFSPASPLGPGVSGTIDAIEVFDGGGGDRLYVAGQDLGMVGGEPIGAFAAWDGIAWTDASKGLDARGPTNIVALEMGGTRSLYAAGSFGGPVEWAGSVLRLDGDDWTVTCDEFGIPWPGSQPAMAVFETSAGEALYLAAAAQFSVPPFTSLARWRDGTWEMIPDIAATSFRADRVILVEAPGLGLLLGGLQHFPESHNMSYIGYDGAIYDSNLWEYAQPGLRDALVVELEPGDPEVMLVTDDVHRHHQVYPVARWDGTPPKPLTDAGPDGPVRTLEAGTGAWEESLFIGGQISRAGAEPATGLARLDDSGLHGVTGLDWYGAPSVNALLATEVNGEPAIIVGGFFNRAGTHETTGVAAWTPSGWRPLGEGLRYAVAPPLGYVSDLTRMPTPSGDWIVAAGDFTHSGTAQVENVAAWDGEGWRALGEAPPVYQTCWFDDGAGGALYATHETDLLRFNGDAWETVATVGGVSPGAGALAVWPGASGPELIMSGTFTQVDSGGTPIAVHNIAAWNGDTWRSIGSLEQSANLHVLDGAAGPRLWATGGFTEVDGQPTDRVAVWDGASWTALGESTWRHYAFTAEAFHYRGTTRVFVGGEFTELAGAPAGFLTYQPGAPCRADLDGDGQLTFFDFLSFNQLYAAGDPTADFDGDGELTFFDFLAFSNEFAAGCP